MDIKRTFLSSKSELTLGVLLIFSSSIGQTFFISLFSGEIRNEFNLSHGIFGTFYSVATLTSAIFFFLDRKINRPIQFDRSWINNTGSIKWIFFSYIKR